MNYINLGGSDPLLGTNPYLSQNPAEVEAQIQMLQEKQHLLEKQRQALSRQAQQPSPAQPQASQAPLWDEIDKLADALSESEMDLIGQNEEFKQSNQQITMLLNREYMRVMRPLVEGTTDGKEALEKHFDLMKRLKKSVSDEAAKNMALFNEYTANYSEMPYAEFLKMKKGGKKK